LNNRAIIYNYDLNNFTSKIIAIQKMMDLIKVKIWCIDKFVDLGIDFANETKYEI